MLTFSNAFDAEGWQCCQKPLPGVRVVIKIVQTVKILMKCIYW